MANQTILGMYRYWTALCIVKISLYTIKEITRFEDSVFWHYLGTVITHNYIYALKRQFYHPSGVP